MQAGNHVTGREYERTAITQLRSSQKYCQLSQANYSAFTCHFLGDSKHSGRVGLSLVFDEWFSSKGGCLTWKFFSSFDLRLLNKCQQPTVKAENSNSTVVPCREQSTYGMLVSTRQVVPISTETHVDISPVCQVLATSAGVPEIARTIDGRLEPENGNKCNRLAGLNFLKLRHRILFYYTLFIYSFLPQKISFQQL